jgi:hypothetical protein
MNMDQGVGQKCCGKRLEWRGFGWQEGAKGKILGSGAAECSQAVHRKCRKQWPVISGQWPERQLAVSIRFMVGEEFSGEFLRRKLLSGEDEWDQLVGKGMRTEGSLLVI